MPGIRETGEAMLSVQDVAWEAYKGAGLLKMLFVVISRI